MKADYSQKYTALRAGDVGWGGGADFQCLK